MSLWMLPVTVFSFSRTMLHIGLVSDVNETTIVYTVVIVSVIIAVALLLLLLLLLLLYVLQQMTVKCSRMTSDIIMTASQATVKIDENNIYPSFFLIVFSTFSFTNFLFTPLR